MNSDAVDKKMTAPADHSQATADAPLKRPWQTPDIIEEDYRETEAGPPPGSLDGGGYS